MFVFNTTAGKRGNGDQQKAWKGNNVIQGQNKAKKGVRLVGHRSVEVGLGLCFQQK
jgi:hypothetical protein